MCLVQGVAAMIGSPIAGTYATRGVSVSTRNFFILILFRVIWRGLCRCRLEIRNNQPTLRDASSPSLCKTLNLCLTCSTYWLELRQLSVFYDRCARVVRRCRRSVRQHAVLLAAVHRIRPDAGIWRSPLSANPTDRSMGAVPATEVRGQRPCHQRWAVNSCNHSVIGTMMRSLGRNSIRVVRHPPPLTYYANDSRPLFSATWITVTVLLSICAAHLYYVDLMSSSCVTKPSTSASRTWSG